MKAYWILNSKKNQDTQEITIHSYTKLYPSEPIDFNGV